MGRVIKMEVQSNLLDASVRLPKHEACLHDDVHLDAFEGAFSTLILNCCGKVSFGDFHPIQAARFGDLKAVKFLDKAIEIYDLSSDPYETTDVSAKFPEAVQKADRIFKEGRFDSEYFPMDRWVWKK